MAFFANRRIITQAIIVFFASILLGIPVYFLYLNTREIIIEEAGKQAVGVAVSVAKFIENDPKPYIELSSIEKYEPGSFDEAYYQDMAQVLREIKANINADFIFTEKKISRTEIAYILDAEVPGSEYFSPIGTTDTLADAEARAFDPGIALSSGLIQDPEWGDYITGFSPIRNPDTGDIIGVVGVDFSADYIYAVLGNIRILMILVSFFLILLIAIGVNKLQSMRSKTLNTDYLTNLYSKRYLSEFISNVIAQSKRSNQVFCLMMMDIDDFKACNDNYGHLFGDKVLVSVSELIKSTIRGKDACFRYGGDEFVVVLPDTTIEQANWIAKRIQNNLSISPQHVNETDTLPITLSIGVAEWNSLLPMEQIVEIADQALYSSKNLGRNRITLYADPG